MKRIIIIMLALCSMTTLAWAAQGAVDLTAGIIDPEAGGNDAPRGPIYVPSASIDGYTFYVSDHPDYVLQLVDPDDETIVYYETDLPEGVNSVILPSTLSGTYEIRLIWGNWYFYGTIELE